MRVTLERRFRWGCLSTLVAVLLTGLSLGQATAGSSGTDSQVSRTAGTLKSAGADSITITSDSGSELTATLTASTRILRVPPGQTDLKNATALQPQDLQPGDRVLVRGKTGEDGHSIMALAVIVMKKSDVSAKQQQERDDWQKRGVGGLVSKVDAASGDITISSSGFAGKRDIVIRTTKNTVARRYAPDSVKFDDARMAPISEIKPGDQLRARGTRNADGSEVTADEIVSGSFRNIAGTITAIDSTANSLTVQDTIRKEHVVVKLAQDSQVKKLPAEFAQRIAMRLKGTGDQSDAPAQTSPPTGGTPPAHPQAAGGMQGQRNNGASDLQRFLSRLPNSALSDLQKGDAVMIVSTEGTNSGTVTAITMLSGVEALLTSSSERNTALMMSQWSLGATPGQGEDAP
jgi:hypothetical protein